MYTQIKTLQAAGKSQREIAKKLELSRRIVAKLIKIETTEAYYYQQRYQRPSGFDKAKEFIDIKILLNPKIAKRTLYRQVINRYPEITLSERAFGYYLEKLNKTTKSEHRPPRSDIYGKIEKGQQS